MRGIESGLVHLYGSSSCNGGKNILIYLFELKISFHLFSAMLKL